MNDPALAPRLDDTDLDDLVAVPAEPDDDVLAMLNARLATAEDTLARKRAQRADLNDDIRKLVADVALLTRARNVFVKPPRKRK